MFIDIEIPEKPKLRFVDKVPQYPSNVRPPKMQKRLMLLRGEEDVHNTLLHKQYGIKVIEVTLMEYKSFKAFINLNNSQIFQYL